MSCIYGRYKNLILFDLFYRNTYKKTFFETYLEQYTSKMKKN